MQLLKEGKASCMSVHHSGFALWNSTISPLLIDKLVKMYWSIGSLLTVVVFLRFWPNKYFTLNYLQPMDKTAE
jgi:hypothetical protein